MSPKWVPVKDSGKNKRIRDVILYLVYRGSPHLTMIRLQKLFYLAELRSICELGRRLTDARFLNHNYGPFSATVAMVADGMADEGIRVDPTIIKGHKARFYRPSKKSVDVDLSEEEMDLLKGLLDDWKYEKTDDIVNHIKTTEPFIWSKFGQEIDFDGYVKCCDKLYRDPKTLREVEENRKAKGRKFASIDELESVIAS